METPESRNSPAEPTPAEGPLKPGAAASDRPGLPGLLWVWALAAGLVAGLGAGLGGEAVYDLFQPVIVYPANWNQLGPFDRPDVLSNLLRKEAPGVGIKNASAAYGMLGLLLGGALGLVAGLARRSAGSALIASLVGVLAGAATGVGMSVALIPVFFRLVDPESGMLLGLLIHAGIWAPIGAAAGLAFGVGLGGRKWIALAMVGGLAGAALGTMAFEVINALAFPDARLDNPIPSDRKSRILGAFCVTILTAMGAALGVGERKTKGERHPLSD
jgi:hypothetical protein